MLYFRMNNLQERMNMAFRHANKDGIKVTKSALANAAGVSRQAVSAWFTGTSKSLESRTLLKVAAFLGVRAEWLDGQGGSMVGSSKSSNVSMAKGFSTIESVPLLTWKQVEELSQNEYIDFSSIEGFQPVMSIFKTGIHGYAMHVEGESMSPQYQAGELIYINPDKEPKHGMRVIALTKQGVTFKELVIEDGVKRLKALNPQWSPQYTEFEKILGVVVGTVRLEDH